MQYRKMGTPELRVSVVGFGGWPMGGRFYGAAMDDEATSTIHAAIDYGINLFDTAAGYGFGHSEKLMGAALRGRRDEVIVVTKFGIEHDPSVQANRLDARPATVRRSCECSLRNLGMDHVDVFLHHWPDPDTPIADTMGTCKELVDEGKVRFVGVSNYTPEKMAEAAAVLPMVANQVGYHMLDRRHAERRFPACEEHGVGVMAYGSLAHGVLAGQLTADTKLDEEDWRGTGYAFGLPLFRADHLPRNLEVVHQVRSLAQQVGLELPQLALRWVIENPTVSTALVGFRNPGEVATAVAAAEADVPAAVMQAADAATRAAYERMLADELPPADLGPLRRNA
ncbi:MAG: aldo/keto reductase [Chloroflexota bacterium]|nr:aldo/keto reductase [Chloroflexota bacterium]